VDVVSLVAEQRSWEAYIATGSVKRAAKQLGVHEQTIKRHLSAIRSRLGVETNVQAAVLLASQLPT
jgi:DNA-binding NarL/FixJ family response regulator